MFLNVVDTRVLFRAMVYFVYPCSNLTRSVRAYTLNSDLEHGRGTRGVRAHALNCDLKHGRGLGPWSIAEKLQLL